MRKVPLGDSPPDDERGFIQDLIGKVDAVTLIHTVEGAVRGNHVHLQTKQWTYVIRGSLCVVGAKEEAVVGPGEMVVHEPGEPHAWKALEDTDCLAFVRGPRAGVDYESDTYKVTPPLIAHDAGWAAAEGISRT